MKFVALLICLGVLMTGAVHGQDYFANESITLDDNEVPEGWQLIRHGGSGGLQNGRLNAYHTNALIRGYMAFAEVHDSSENKAHKAIPITGAGVTAEVGRNLVPQDDNDNLLHLER